MKDKLDFKNLLSKKAFVYAGIIVLLIILWPLISTLGRIIAIAYLIWTFISMAGQRFSSPEGWFKLVLAVALLIFVFVITSPLFIVILILIALFDLLYNPSKK
jgi:hypothetical protein